MSRPGDDVAERFRALASHPELPARMAAARVRAGSGVTPGMIALLAAVALLGLFTSLLFFAFCPPLGLLPLALVGFGGYALVHQLWTRARATRTRLPVLVVELRVRLEGEASARSRRQALVELADGTRRELEVAEEAADQVRPGDMGVAELEGATLIAFTRLDV